MSDLRARELERRWRETRHPADRLAWLRARARAGGLPPERLALEALLGDSTSRRLLGWGLDADVDDAARLFALDRPWITWLAARAVEEVLPRCPVLVEGPRRAATEDLLARVRECARAPTPDLVGALPALARAALDGACQNESTLMELPAHVLARTDTHRGACLVHRALRQVSLAAQGLLEPTAVEDPGWQARASLAAAAVAIALASRAADADRGGLVALLRASDA